MMHDVIPLILWALLSVCIAFVQQLFLDGAIFPFGLLGWGQRALESSDPMTSKVFDAYVWRCILSDVIFLGSSLSTSVNHFFCFLLFFSLSGLVRLY